MKLKIIAPIVFALGFVLAGLGGDLVNGRSAFEKRCTGCHALDHEKVGPRLGGVVGRKAGTISTFEYSDALKKSGVIWSEEVLDKWLTDPESVVPDTDMTFRLNDRAERAAIIAYLKGIVAKNGLN